MSAIITIPLEKNKDIAGLVADMQPGDRVYCCGTIKAMDDQTLTIRVEEMADKPDDLPEPDKTEPENDAEAKAEDGVEEQAGNGSTPGEAQEASDLSGGYLGPK